MRAAGADRAGEADRRDVGIVDQRFADDRAAPHHEVEHAGGNAGLRQDLGERPRAARHEVRRLEHDGVAVRERGRDLPGRNRDRKIPRRDEADDADRLARHLDVDAGAHRRQLLAREAQRFAGEELEDVPGPRRLADAFGQRLAFLARQEPAELVLAREDFGADAIEEVRSLLDRARRPRRSGRFGGGDRRARLRGIGLRVFADHVADVRRIAIGRCRSAGDPFAGDEVAVKVGHGVVPFVSEATRVRAGRAAQDCAISAPTPKVHGRILSE